MNDVESLFGAIYEDPPFTGPTSNISVHLPISHNELSEAISSWRPSAPGPGGITLAQVKGCPLTILATLYNIVLYRRFTPTVWTTSRTVLIEKEGDPRTLTNWRPITIGPAAQRLLHRKLARRLLRMVDLHPLQRGFRNIDGTLANSIVVDHYVKARRAAGKAYNIVSLP